ncbi:MAG: YihA family ribosome biogenesis GTP-binding protein [Alphaproteobacteria bacterium]|jgi:GTP-binding protein|nr:YihA family ribosome biogenesis GTP-binding protein [Alphaproteobacteria bacterium]
MSTGPEEDARRLFAGEAAFAWAATTPGDLPPGDRPEVAFAGRSNVGKSSLINALLGRKLLARTSHTPGRTRALHFYDIAGGRARLVDMPGYGYAKVSKAERAAWEALLHAYIHGRRALRAVCVLMDSRHGAKDSDAAFLLRAAEAGVPARVVWTKADKASTTPGLPGVPGVFAAPLVTSARGGTGLAQARLALAQDLGLVQSGSSL